MLSSLLIFIPMNTSPQIPPLVVFAAMATLVSCTSMRDAGKSSVAAMKHSSSAAAAKVSSLAKMPKMPDFGIARLLPGERIKIVEVREKDLKELPTGHELARAHAASRNSGFWIFGGPVDFQEPALPEPGADLDGSLLPPRMP